MLKFQRVFSHSVRESRFPISPPHSDQLLYINIMSGSSVVCEPPQMTSPTTPRRLPLSHSYTPSRSSPLSSHPQTTPQNRFGLKMLPSPPSSPPEFLAPKRLFKPVPSSHSREEGREARRNLFLKKVRDARDEKLLKARGGEDEVWYQFFLRRISLH